MEKEFVKYEQALALKELGFNEICTAAYVDKEFKYVWELKGWHPENYVLLNNNRLMCPKDSKVSSPTFSQAFRWFREKYKLKFFIREDMWNDWCTVYICTGGRDPDYIDYGEFKYEEAELECLKKLIEIVSEDKEEDDREFCSECDFPLAKGSGICTNMNCDTNNND